MKKILFVIILALLSGIKITAQNWLWVNSVNTSTTPPAFGEGASVAVDGFGNVYTGGTFNGLSTAGSYTFNANGASRNAYILKYDANGNVLWARTSMGGWESFGIAVSADINGNVYMVGYFGNTNITFGTTTLTCSGGTNIFLVKYDPNGNLLWAKSSVGTTGDEGYSLSNDANGNTYISGKFSSPTIVFGTYTLTNTGTANAFIVKYDANGNVLWAKNPTGTGVSEGDAVSVDNTGNIFMGGYFTGSTLVAGTTTLTNINTGTKDLFLIKYDANGNALWAKSAAGFNNEKAFSVSADATGNVYVTGHYVTSAVFGAFTVSGSNSANFFLAKYDANGNEVWVKTATANNIWGWSISNYLGDIYVIGAMDSGGTPMTIGSFTLNAPTGYLDPLFIARYDASGNVISASALSSGADDFVTICLDHSCQAYISGDFFVPSFAVGANTLTLTGFENSFTAKFSFTSTNCPIAAVNELSEVGIEIILFPNPNTGSFKLQCDNEIKNGELFILNSIGQTVHQQKITQSTNEITTKGFSKGLYYYSVHQNNMQIKTGKISID